MYMYYHVLIFIYIYRHVSKTYTYRYVCVLTIPDSSPLVVSSEVPLRDGLYQALESQRLQGACLGINGDLHGNILGKHGKIGDPSIRNGGNHGISMGKW